METKGIAKNLFDVWETEPDQATLVKNGLETGEDSIIGYLKNSRGCSSVGWKGERNSWLVSTFQKDTMESFKSLC